jgi:hypothetical protein
MQSQAAKLWQQVLDQMSHLANYIASGSTPVLVDCDALTRVLQKLASQPTQQTASTWRALVHDMQVCGIKTLISA